MIKEHELDKLIICKKCHTLHEKVLIAENEKAFCSECNVLLYHNDSDMLDKMLALVITASISLFVAFQFTVVSINIQGMEKSLTLTSLFMVLAEHKQYIVGIMFLFLIVIFPIVIIFATFLLLFFMKIEKAGYLTKRLLILLAHLKPWSMIDIFFISLLVAMVKLFDIANIELGVAFLAFVLTLMLDILITKSLSFHQLWEIHHQIYGSIDEE
ncbi:MAG: Paraquat-inducible protein A [uncultured Sulfurovum sp.]|uniref:Paraquat-inducible protein A n=1 Tax=uncultured Sulfurovum sp. TaxID=269237 RepID=A0A6S6U381_9BACT|nr:MAG: Paraquat-inducible protein A [uncultured Sulfurovum sp.]